MLGTAAFVASSAWLVGGVPSQAGIIVEPWIDTSNRDAVAVAYGTEYAAGSPDMDWTGNYETCDAGDASERLAMATLRRVNFYRAMAGVPAGVTLSAEYSRKAQHAALAMSATGRLSHTPDDSFDCLSSTGREAAANSNLYLGRTGPTAIDGYIEDPGDRNRDVGHRNTILHPPTSEIGVGHVQGSGTAYPANALWVFDEAVFADNPALREPEGFVAWPPRGFVPPELVYPRWSFGLIDANFDNATVTMTADGQPIELEVVARLSQKGYVPSPIIVWEPVADPGSDDPSTDAGVVGTGAAREGLAGDGLLTIDAAYDTSIDIVIAGVVVDGAEVSFFYSVVVMGDEPAVERIRSLSLG
ncbi:MAG: CAP domain-containing protein [Acidimicrobiales bacterium]